LKTSSGLRILDFLSIYAIEKYVEIQSTFSLYFELDVPVLLN
jgi:hypothetical protein